LTAGVCVSADERRIGLTRCLWSGGGSAELFGGGEGEPERVAEGVQR
jgi:hypothetical protein